MQLESALSQLFCLKFSFQLVSFSKSYAKKQKWMFFSEHSVEMGFWANKITDYRAHCCHTPAYCVQTCVCLSMMFCHSHCRHSYMQTLHTDCKLLCVLNRPSTHASWRAVRASFGIPSVDAQHDTRGIISDVGLYDGSEAERRFLTPWAAKQTDFRSSQADTPVSHCYTVDCMAAQGSSRTKPTRSSAVAERLRDASCH